jgi:HEAT repeat protein
MKKIQSVLLTTFLLLNAGFFVCIVAYQHYHIRPCPNPGTPEAAWRDEQLWERTSDYRITMKMLRDILANGDALHNLTDQEVDVLIANMRSPYYEARTTAVIGCGDDQYPKAVKAKLLPHILTLLHDPDSGVRMFAASSLGRMGDKSVIPPLQAMKNDSRPVVASVAREAVAKLEEK